MNKLYLLLITLLFSLCLCASEAESNQKIDVTKEYTEENGLYRFTVKYKKGANVVGLITQVSIWDSLPEYLELTEGVLVKKLPNAGDNWETNEYVARLVDYEFTLDNRTLTLTIPPAEITFNSGSKLETAVSNTFDIKVRGPKIPTGFINFPLAVAGAIYILPLVAAYFVIKSLSSSALTVKEDKKKN
eukprot:TRINITY_DN7124_c0_g1_i2.p1 TRINITY_DN7124_c0_g1~~TRINITY_DN7124_c0_g1_i2.p1  ORF type:complete len:188 (-),score=42.59 TRINITY_DN7124_c0_g1_i2:80-643(-)